MADAEAICEAVTRPTMRFVPVKSPEQQGVMVLHRTRLVLTRQRTQFSNAIRGHMAEFGLTAAIGREGLGKLIAVILDRADPRVPGEARICLTMLVDQLRLVNLQILETDRLIRTNARATEVGRRLMEIPGVGPLLASAMVAAVADPAAFKTGRNLAAWIGLVPRQNSSGGKERLGDIAKQGDRYLRQLADHDAGRTICWGADSTGNADPESAVEVPRIHQVQAQCVDESFASYRIGQEAIA